jgi:hypothetical protein
MKKNSVLFSATGDFPLVFITEEDYLKNKNNSTGLENLNKTPFARVYAFYNLTGTNNTIYEVSGKLGGSNKLEISNLTSYNVELRLDGIYGEPLGFASKGMVKQAIYVNDGDYSVFPVFKLYNPIRDIIQTIYPKWSTGLPKSFDLSFLGNSTVGVDVKTYIDSTVNMSTGAAYLIINNQAGATGIQLFKGATPITNSVGIATINPTDTRTYQIDMPGIAGSGAFADHLSISGYQVGTRGNTVSIGDHTLYVDKMYTVTVKFNDGVFSTEFEDSGTVSWEDFRN